MPPRSMHPALRQKKGAKPSAREFVVAPLQQPELPTRTIQVQLKDQGGKPIRDENGQLLYTAVEGQWHSQAVENWLIRWGSALAVEYMDVDVTALKRLLAMETEYFEGVERGKGRVTLAVEVRQVEEALGLPLTKRYSLDWTQAATENLEANTAQIARPHADYDLPASEMTEMAALD